MTSPHAAGEARAPTRPFTLAALPTGQPAVIEDIARVEDDALLRLREMGMTPQTTVTVTRRGVTGDPLEVEVRGTRLCLRRAHADCFVVRAPGAPLGSPPVSLPGSPGRR